VAVVITINTGGGKGGGGCHRLALTVATLILPHCPHHPHCIIVVSSMQVLVMVELGQFTGSGGVVNSYNTGAGMVTMVLSLSLLWVLQVVIASSG